MGVMLALLLQAVPIDWANLPELSYRAAPVVTPRMNAFVAHAVDMPHCQVPAVAKTAASLSVDVAVLVEPDGSVRSAVPRAIQCPEVEQYASGLVTAFARNNLLPRGAQSEQWYRATLTFNWHK